MPQTLAASRYFSQIFHTYDQFNERLLLWQPSGIFLYSTVIIFICFMLCWRIKYDYDNDGSASA